jgi:hypothetical protein
MKTRAFVALLICLLLAPATDAAQRRRKSAPKKAPAAEPAADPAADADRQAAAQRVADQIKALSHFLYILGGIAKNVEAVDQASHDSNVPPEAVQATERNKAAVKQSIQNVRIGLEQLENDFSSKSSLRPYYHLILGVADIAATASQQADAGQFDPAGRSLLKAVDKLTEALLAMRRTP